MLPGSVGKFVRILGALEQIRRVSAFAVGKGVFTIVISGFYLLDPPPNCVLHSGGRKQAHGTIREGESIPRPRVVEKLGGFLGPHRVFRGGPGWAAAAR